MLILRKNLEKKTEKQKERNPKYFCIENNIIYWDEKRMKMFSSRVSDLEGTSRNQAQFTPALGNGLLHRMCRLLCHWETWVAMDVVGILHL